ncbi:MAG: hypothetical protein ACM3X1_06305 [Ignavibacteriales bacterium]
MVSVVIAVTLLSSIVCASSYLLQHQQPVMAQSNNNNNNDLNPQVMSSGILSKVSFSDSDTLSDEGNKLLGEGKYKEAISVYDKAFSYRSKSCSHIKQ